MNELQRLVLSAIGKDANQNKIQVFHDHRWKNISTLRPTVMWLYKHGYIEKKFTKPIKLFLTELGVTEIKEEKNNG